MAADVASHIELYFDNVLVSCHLAVVVGTSVSVSSRPNSSAVGRPATSRMAKLAFVLESNNTAIIIASTVLLFDCKH